MSDEMSQATFEIMWDEVLNPSTNSLTETSSEEFKQQYDIDINELFEEFPDPDTTISSPTAINAVPITPTPHESTPTSKEFVDFNSSDVQNFISNEENKSTMKKTLCDVSKFERFLKNKHEDRELNDIGPDQLDEHLANFILSVRKPDGEEYEPSSLRNIVSSIDRKLRRTKYPAKVFGESTNAFQLTRDSLHAKLKSLKRLGKGNKPNKSSPITDMEIDILYEKGVLGPKDGKSLLNTVWFNNCVMFGLRGTKENYNLRWGDVQLSKTSDGYEYLELTERQTKTRNGLNISDIRKITPKIFENRVDSARCPVQMYKLYTTKRPQDFCKPEHPFYIAPRTGAQKCTDTWFNKMIVGEKTIGGLLKVMAKEGGLYVNKRLTNHSTRKHLVQKLRDSGIAPTDIMQISGHRNIQSVMNYSEMSEEKQKQCCNILSSSRPPSSATPSSDVSYSVQSVSEPDRDVANNEGIIHDTIQRPCVGQSEEPFPMATNSVSTSSLNTQMNALFSGATLNIQQFNVYMK